MSWYQTGSVAVTNNNTAVVGTGTIWVANVQAGDVFWGPDGRGYEVVAVNSNTSLTIGPAYAGATAAGQAYRIAPTQGRVIVLTEGVNELLTQFGAIRDGIGSGNFPDGSAAAPALRFGADTDTGLFRAGANALGFATGGVERLRMDGGNIGIGTSAPGEKLQVEGNVLLPLSSANSGAVLGYPSSQNFTTAGAVIPRFGLKWFTPSDGGGNAEAALAGYGGLRFYSQDALRIRVYQDGTIAPGADATQAFGTGSRRWHTLYAQTGAINTSDTDEKEWLGAGFSPAELTAARRISAEIGSYRWLASIAEKGDDARIHIGVRAQAVWAIMADEGLIDPIEASGTPSSRYAFLCYDEWDATDPVAAVKEVRDEDGNIIIPGQPFQPGVDAGHLFGIRPDQLVLFLIAAQEARIAAIEASPL